MKRIISVIIAFCLINIACLCGCGEPDIVAVSPTEGASVALVNDSMLRFVQNYELGSSDRYVSFKDNFAPKEIELSWTAEGEAKDFEIEVSTNFDFKNAERFRTTESKLILEELLVNYTYYWRVRAIYDDGESLSEVFTFNTENTPRTIKINGVSNTRDIGGKNTSSGKRVKQKMAYRGAYLDEIGEIGREKALGFYDIKTDLDLRREAEGTAGSGSPLGEDVQYINYSCPYYLGGNGIDSYENQANLASAIKVFADEKNYPIYFHCSVGRDRTSMIAMLILGLLGVSETDICIDYETSAFSYRGTMDKASMDDMARAFSNTMGYILMATGERDFDDACEAFLLSIGVSGSEIASIRAIMLED